MTQGRGGKTCVYLLSWLIMYTLFLCAPCYISSARHQPRNQNNSRSEKRSKNTTKILLHRKSLIAAAMKILRVNAGIIALGMTCLTYCPNCVLTMKIMYHCSLFCVTDLMKCRQTQDLKSWLDKMLD